MGLLAWIKSLFVPRYDVRLPEYHRSAFIVRSLPSTLTEAHFGASLEATWEIGDGNRPDTEEAYDAHRQLRDVLERATENFSVLLLEEAQSQAEIALYRAARDIDRRLMSVRITLSVDEKVKAYAEMHEEVLRDNALAEARFQTKAHQARYVRDHLLSDAQMARLWWLDGQPGKLPELLKMGNDFEQVVGLIKTGLGPATTPEEAVKTELIAQLIKDFLTPLSPQHREILLSQLGQVFSGYEREDLAHGLRDLNGKPAGN
ncbi:hypothetical protein [Streptosporangium sp. NBC_01756]|uniref:hypothetical protein n=1 Tax=Streptosporangium sp. NBC_01756 TaxID=2975950 RepID=UPI002DD8416B|nr:hypothetical protein [Streptosporangium sp. NBC_01756]WSC88250.1 hypothetical protein OIE48_08710 [Streptosporangium sp. NBC_01756]